MTKNALIFDLDGTLVDTLSDITYSVNEMLRHYGFDGHTEDEIRKMIGKGSKNLISRSLPENMRSEDFIAEALAYYVKCYENNLTVRTYVYDGLIEVLQEFKAKGYRMAVLSNKDDRHVKEIVNTLMPDVFVSANGFSPLYPHKPAPDSVLAIMREMGISAEETAFIGDSAVDIRTAANAGLFSVGVSWGFGGADSFRDAAPDMLVHTPKQLLEI